MKHTFVTTTRSIVMTAVLALGVGIGTLFLPTHRAAADDETGDTEIKIQAPLDGVDCTANTISVLGLTIDISTAAIHDGNGDGGKRDANRGGGASDGNSQGGDNGNTNGGQSGCTALVANQPVEVKLASDNTPLAATRVSRGGGDNEVKVEAPIQFVDATAKTITALGLVVDVSQANVGGADDNSQDGNSQPIDLTQVMQGQFVEMSLASNQPPLSATEVRVLNFANQVEVEVDNSNGQQVDDMDDNGNPVDDVDVEVDETVTVQNTTPGAPGMATKRVGTATKRVRKVLHLHRTSNGDVMLSGLATGLAKISVTRTANGVTSVGRRSLAVRPNTLRHVRMRLHRTK